MVNTEDSEEARRDGALADALREIGLFSKNDRVQAIIERALGPDWIADAAVPAEVDRPCVACGELDLNVSGVQHDGQPVTVTHEDAYGHTFKAIEEAAGGDERYRSACPHRHGFDHCLLVEGHCAPHLMLDDDYPRYGPGRREYPCDHPAAAVPAEVGDAT